MNMKITTVLFDLDGTLLPMDQDVFIKDYFGRLARKLAPYGYEPKKLIEAVRDKDLPADRLPDQQSRCRYFPVSPRRLCRAEDLLEGIVAISYCVGTET